MKNYGRNNIYWEISTDFLQSSLFPRGHKEMSSILADQCSALVYEPKCGGRGERGGCNLFYTVRLMEIEYFNWAVLVLLLSYKNLAKYALCTYDTLLFCFQVRLFCDYRRHTSGCNLTERWIASSSCASGPLDICYSLTSNSALFQWKDTTD